MTAGAPGEKEKPATPSGNGCGPAWLPRWAWPDFGFEKECDAHDAAYGAGGGERERFSADSTFFEEMNRRAASQKNILKRIGQSLVVPVNHLLVRIGGFASFRYRKKEK